MKTFFIISSGILSKSSWKSILTKLNIIYMNWCIFFIKLVDKLHIFFQNKIQIHTQFLPIRIKQIDYLLFLNSKMIKKSKVFKSFFNMSWKYICSLFYVIGCIVNSICKCIFTVLPGCRTTKVNKSSNDNKDSLAKTANTGETDDQQMMQTITKNVSFFGNSRASKAWNVSDNCCWYIFKRLYRFFARRNKPSSNCSQ